MRSVISTAHSSLRNTWRSIAQHIAAGGQLTWVALTGLCLVLFVPGCQSIPATDRDESRYAQASRQILESGDWVDIRFQDELRLKKPPGIYWLQAGVRQVLDLPDHIGSYRLPSLLGATLAVLLFYALSRRLLDRREALWPPVLLATSFLLGAEARLATTDAVLLLCTMLAAAVLTLRWIGRAWPHDDLLLACAVAAGVLVKGPVVLALVAGMVGAALLLRRCAALAGALSLRGVLLAAALVLPWFLLIVARHGDTFWQASVLHDVAGKAVAAQESHGQPPGFYLLTLPLAGWPWAALLPAIAWHAWRSRAEPLTQALLAWLLPLWVLFELAPTKLVHYVLPTYPALVLLAVGAWRQRHEWPRGVRVACIALLLLGAVLISVVGAGLAWKFGAPALAVAVFAVAVLLAVATLLLQRSRGVPVFLLVVAFAYTHWWGRVLPAMDALWVSHRVAALAAVVAPACDAPPLAEGFGEPSLVFELGTATRIGRAMPLPAAAHCRLHIVKVDAASQGEYPAGKHAGHVAGFNYAKGKAIHLAIYKESTR